MKAIILKEYGSPNNLHLKEVDKPKVKDNEVLIKLKSASINSWDLDIVKGNLFLIRLMYGLRKPKLKILGCDIAGVVEALGKNVKKFKTGDEVFGDISASGWGGFAEYVCADEVALEHKPSFITFEEAAALPQAGVMALQSLQDNKQIGNGDRVLIIGAGGGVGTIAIQIAKDLGAEVTAVDRKGKLDKLLSLGADYVIDYQLENFTKNGQQYDLILDVVANLSIFDYKGALKPNGNFEMIGGSMKRLLQVAFMGPIISKLSRKRLGILMHEPNKNLLQLTSYIEQGKMKPIIDKQYNLADTMEAFRYYAEGNVFGKIVITM